MTTHDATASPAQRPDLAREEPKPSAPPEDMREAAARIIERAISTNFHGPDAAANARRIATEILALFSTRIAELELAHIEEADSLRDRAIERTVTAKAAEAENKLLREALEPFAKFNLSGFDGEVLEVVPSTPSNPARRIEPIWTSHFRRASEAVSRVRGKEDQGRSVASRGSALNAAPSTPSPSDEGGR